jgi:hypothetical protein
MNDPAAWCHGASVGKTSSMLGAWAITPALTQATRAPYH